MKMNKKVLAMALAAFVATAGMTISAANDDNNATLTEQTGKACKNKKDCKKGDCKKGEGRKGDCKKGDGKRGENPMFKGIELTEEQQAAVQNFKKQHCEATKAEKKAACEKNREAFMQEMKNILTPEQYQQLEKNVAEMQANKEQHKGDMNCKGGKHGHHGQRPDRESRK